MAYVRVLRVVILVRTVSAPNVLLATSSTRGGCYSVSKEPGRLMCKTATNGICTAATGQYFAVPGATDKQQSVLACENPVDAAVGERAYVGVEDCRTCEAPAEASNGAMAAAKCTACDGSKKPTGSGHGCVTCGVAGCTTCKADNACEACALAATSARRP